MRLLFASVLGVLSLTATPARSVEVWNPGSWIYQDFNTLPDGANGSSHVWLNNVTLTGWHGARASGSVTNIRVADGRDGTGNTLLSYGTIGSSDKALGTRNSSEAWLAFGVRLVNRSGVPLYRIEVSYALEQWYGGAGTGDALSVAISLNATNLTDAAATWIPIPALSASAPPWRTREQYSIQRESLLESRDGSGLSYPALPVATGYTALDTLAGR